VTPHAAATAARLRRADIPAATDRRRTSSASDVLRAVLDHGPGPRSTIARLAGLSPAAAGRYCTDLVRAGLVREVPRQGGRNGAGRPHVPVDISDERHAVCGLHIGALASTLAMVDLRGRVIARESRPHGGQPAAEVLTRVARRIPGFAAEHAPRQPAAYPVAGGTRRRRARQRPGRGHPRGLTGTRDSRCGRGGAERPVRPVVSSPATAAA
jgi:hypothetical protein